MVDPMFDPEAAKRRSQLSILTGGNPGVVGQLPSNTMPIGGAPQVQPVQPQKQTPSAGVGLIGSAPPPGWDARNWSDPNMHSVKYDAGRLLYGATKPSDVASRVSSADFQKRFPGATFDGKDNIDFKGALSDGDSGVPVGLIDVLMAADREGDTSNGIWWGAPEAQGAGGGAPASGGQKGSGLNPLMDNSALTRIMAEITAASNDDQSPAEREAILQLLQGGL